MTITPEIIGYAIMLVGVYIAIKLDVNTLKNRVSTLEKDDIEQKENLKQAVEELTKSTNKLHTEVHGLNIQIKHLNEKYK